MDRVLQVTAGAEYKLTLIITDGTTGTVDISQTLFGPVFEPLLDPALFGQAYVDDYGAICWPNGADLAPDALYSTVKGISDLNAALAS